MFNIKLSKFKLYCQYLLNIDYKKIKIFNCTLFLSLCECANY